MSIKVKKDEQDEDNFMIDIPLFDTSQDVVKDIKIEVQVKEDKEK